jgi:heme-degrading monooxygenase HmoA
MVLTDMSDRDAVIARIWSGTVRTTDAGRYADYIRETGFTEYGKTPGNRGAWLLRRDDGDGTSEFMTLSLWDTVAAIRAFAGEDIEAAVLYPEDERYLIGETQIRHYDVADHIAKETD